jgi:hypothetical protein
MLGMAEALSGNMTNSHAHHVTLQPKNGRWLVALIAGAPADRARELRDKLSGIRGILAKHHWDYEKKHDFQGSIPTDVDFVLIIKSQLGHANEDRVVAACQRAGVPFIRTSHKWVNIDQNLRLKFGIHKAEPLPLSIRSFTPFLEPVLSEPAEPTVEAIRPYVPPPQPAGPITIRVENAHIYNNPSAMSKLMALVTAVHQHIGDTDVTQIVITPTGFHVDTEEQEHDVAVVMPEEKPAAPKVHRVTNRGENSLSAAILASLDRVKPMRWAEICAAVNILLDGKVSTNSVSAALTAMTRDGKIVRTGTRRSYAYCLPADL